MKFSDYLAKRKADIQIRCHFRPETRDKPMIHAAFFFQIVLVAIEEVG